MKLSIYEQAVSEGVATSFPQTEDIIENGKLDLADIALEQVALNLDDYPRAEGEVFDYAKYADFAEDEKENPFAVLAKLKK